MIQDRGAQVIDWLAMWLVRLGDEAVDLFWETVDWVESLGVYGYGLGAGMVLLVVLVLLWYGSRRSVSETQLSVIMVWT